MDAPGIVERLRARFGAAIGELVTDNPDPYVGVAGAQLPEVATFLRDEPGIELDFLESVSGLEVGDKLWVVYHLLSYKHRTPLVLKVEVSPTAPEVPSVGSVWPAAFWHEREQYDLFGVRFTGHPDLRRIMLPEDWVGHPLRKAYQDPEEYHGIRHARPQVLDQLKSADAVRYPRPAPAPASPPTPTTPQT
jgi:NADH-quinone oxidoreductase subunit C